LRRNGGRNGWLAQGAQLSVRIKRKKCNQKDFKKEPRILSAGIAEPGLKGRAIPTIARNVSGQGTLTSIRATASRIAAG